MRPHDDRLSGYPSWIRNVITETEPAKVRVRDHLALGKMANGTISAVEHRNLLIGFWSLIEKFPHFMALNLLKTSYGYNRGINSARAWLAKNLRIEQRHADWFVAWAEAVGVDRAVLFDTHPRAEMTALTDWCWQVCHTGSLPTAMAATNYAIEGVTGEWCPKILESKEYRRLIRDGQVESGLRWLRAHAAYDDEHPWEAMDIICAIVGPNPVETQVREVEHAIRKTYDLHRLAFDAALESFPQAAA